MPSAATISIVVALVAACAIPLIWQLSLSRERIAPAQRALTDVDLTWHCDAGHSFIAAGQVEPRRCWHCEELAYPATRYYCPVHGAFGVTVRFQLDDNGEPAISHVRLTGREWVAAEDSLPCPLCGRQLYYRPEDPLEARRRGAALGD